MTPKRIAAKVAKKRARRRKIDKVRNHRKQCMACELEHKYGGDSGKLKHKDVHQARVEARKLKKKKTKEQKS